MAEASGPLTIQTHGSLVLVQVTRDRLLEMPVINAIGVELTALLAKHARPSVVIDLTQVAYLSSAMVGKLIAFYKAVTEKRGRLAIAGARPDLMPIFKITQVDRLIRFYPDAKQVLLEYKNRPL